MFNVVDGKGRDEDKEIVQMFVLFAGQFGEHLDHQIQVVNLIAEIILKFAQDIIQLFTGGFSGFTQIGLGSYLFDGLLELYLDRQKLH